MGSLGTADQGARTHRPALTSLTDALRAGPEPGNKAGIISLSTEVCLSWVSEVWAYRSGTGRTASGTVFCCRGFFLVKVS